MKEIQECSKGRFKAIVKKACEKAGFHRLLSDREKLSKGKKLIYNEGETQAYLLPGHRLNIHEMRKIMKMRLRDTDVRMNFPNLYSTTLCPIQGCTFQESQQHLVSCSSLTQFSPGFNNSFLPTDFSFEDLYQSNV